MAIVIKKKVSLEFLGEDYKEAYLTFQSIPAGDFTELLKKLKEIEEKEEESITLILDLLKQYFIEGQFPGDNGLEPVKKEDLDGLDPQSLTECFKTFTGQELDPKDEKPLTTTLPTAESPQEK